MIQTVYRVFIVVNIIRSFFFLLCRFNIFFFHVLRRFVVRKITFMAHKFVGENPNAHKKDWNFDRPMQRRLFDHCTTRENCGKMSENLSRDSHYIQITGMSAERKTAWLVSFLFSFHKLYDKTKMLYRPLYSRTGSIQSVKYDSYPGHGR